MAPKSLPDVLVIVLDAVRSQDVYSDREGTIRDLPFLTRFHRESAVFPQAIAAASWTLPSVASLLTGLYPWEHGVSALGGSYLDASLPTLATSLRAQGYSTVLLSANNVVGPRTNLSQGFERTYVADWWEQYLRLHRATPGETGSSVGESSPGRAGGTFAQLRRIGSRKAMRLGFRFPGLLEGASEFAQRLRDPGRPLNVRVAPWIETTLLRVLCETPRSRPLFCLVHLNDAHEPYFRPAPSASWPEVDSRGPVVRQDYMRLIEGSWAPDAPALEALHALYRTMIRELDQRIETLIAAFTEGRDLDNTLVLITADHGQAFGEGGWLFHMSSAEESLLRVPLIVRFPGQAVRGRGKSWASPVDLVPTVFELLDLPSSDHLHGRPLQRLFSEERDTPVWALGDGLPLRHLEGIVNLPPERRGSLATRTWLAAYQGSSKLTYDLQAETFDIRQVETPLALEESAPGYDDARIFQSRGEAVRLAELIVTGRERQESVEVSRRLDSWGYGV